MAPKRRDPRNSDLTGTSIKHHRRAGKDYYYYIMPVRGFTAAMLFATSAAI